MSKPETKWSPFQQAFLRTASRLDEEGKWRTTGNLSEAASLAVLRRLLLLKLGELEGVEENSPRPADGDSLSGMYDFAKRLACPLLDDDLAPSRPVSGSLAVGLAEVPGNATGLGEAFTELRDVELARRRSGKGGLYLKKSPSRRRRSGMFFTPDWMAQRLVSLALDPFLDRQEAGEWSESLRLLDPACGSGRLLVAAVSRIASKYGLAGKERAELVRRLISRSLRGLDIDPVAAAIARTSLWLEADPKLGPVEGLYQAIVTGDAIGGPMEGRKPKGAVDWRDLLGTKTGAPKGFDVIVANPPFEVLKGFARRKGLKDYVGRIRKCGYNLALHGNLNTYRLFLERSLDVLEPNGSLAFVLPYGFLMDRTAGPLRSHMVKSGWMRRVEAYPESSRAFEDVGQSVILLSLAKARSSSCKILISDGTGEQEECSVTEEQLAALDEKQVPIPVSRSGSFGLAAKLRNVNGACFGDLADGRVGEVDQTVYARFMKSKPSASLLVRGIHLEPFLADLDTGRRDKRWLDSRGFDRARGKGQWRADIEAPRVVQTGIVNMEAARRLVAARVPVGIYCGNSLNYWVPKGTEDLDEDLLRAYVLGLLNSTPLEWRFRLTSSNNNINLYEVRSLPLPRWERGFPAERIDAFIEQATSLVADSRSSVLGTVRQITAGWGSPTRADRAVGMLIGRVAAMRESEPEKDRQAWLDAVLDHLVNWHLGMDEPDLEQMLLAVPARRLEESL